MQKNKILVFTQGKETPSSRFRILQYVKYLEPQGIILTIKPSIPSVDFSPRILFAWVYHKNKWLARALGILAFSFMIVKRCMDITTAGSYDAVVLQRALLPFGPPILETLLRLVNKKIVFDFDDAIFITRDQTIRKIISHSMAVIAGNNYLGDFAKKYNKNVIIIPTVIDTAAYTPKKRTTDATVTIGYMGSSSNLKYLRPLQNMLSNILEKYPQTRLVIVSKFKGIEFSFIPKTIYKEWSPQTEVEDLNMFDIGLMPLEENAWAQGKCGAKLLQYMALEIPAIASDVGVNGDIVQHEVNGFLVRKESDWERYLSFIIENPAARKKIGIAARVTVEEKYSIHAVLGTLSGALQGVAKQ